MMRALFVLCVMAGMGCDQTVACTPGSDAPLTVAVSSNYYPVALKLASLYEHNTGVRVRLVNGSTGKLFHQIVYGLPVDVFLSADKHHIDKLIEKNLVASETSTVYALGELVLLVNTGIVTGGTLKHALAAATSKEGSKIALANPKLAPYGKAAKQTLNNLGAWPCERSCVYGENVSSAFQYFYSGAVSAVFVARSLVKRSPLASAQTVAISDSLYDPLLQVGGVTTRSLCRARAQSFLKMLVSPQGLAITESFGYKKP